MPTAIPRMIASVSEMMMTCAVWLSVRVMSGQIGWNVSRDLPSLCVTTSWSQNQ